MIRFCVAGLVLLSGSVAVADNSWTTLRGRVLLDGDVPPVKEINVTSDQGHCLEKGKILDEKWVVQPGSKGIKNVFVWLASDGATSSGKNLPVHPSLKSPVGPSVEMEQPRCAFVPHVVGLREGQSLIVKNNAPVTHNVRWTGHPLKNPGSNETIVPGKSVTISNLKFDRYPVNIACSMHPWMNGVVRVFDHPYFAVTADDGSFEIKLAPVGKHRLFVWHEAVGWKGGAAGKNGDEIAINAGDATDVGKLLIKP